MLNDIHIIKLLYIRDKSDKIEGIFCYKTVLSTETPDIVVWIMEKEYPGEHRKQRNLLNSGRILDNKVSKVVVVENFIHRLHVVIDKKCHDLPQYL